MCIQRTASSVGAMSACASRGLYSRVAVARGSPRATRSKRRNRYAAHHSFASPFSFFSSQITLAPPRSSPRQPPPRDLPQSSSGSVGGGHACQPIVSHDSLVLHACTFILPDHNPVRGTQKRARSALAYRLRAGATAPGRNVQGCSRERVSLSSLLYYLSPCYDAELSHAENIKRYHHLQTVFTQSSAWSCGTCYMRRLARAKINQTGGSAYRLPPGPPRHTSAA